VEEDDRFSASDIEFRLPTPSYTIDTLTYLEEKNPDKGVPADHGFRWAEDLSQMEACRPDRGKYHRLIYPRPGRKTERSAAAIEKCHCWWMHP
jgi:nicotinate-nucleotide adenylyltransferase